MLKTYTLFSEEEAAKMVADVEALDWKEGQARTGLATGTVKKNLELLPTDGAEVLDLLTFIQQSICNHKEIQRDTLMGRVLHPKFNRYEKGGTYNRHMDCAFMGPDQLRTDLSCTVFLTDPSKYKGGELKLERSTGETLTVSSGKPGTCIIYPSKDLHWVEPVTEGYRISAVTWIESYVQDELERDLLTRFRGVLLDMENDPDLAWGEHFTTLTMIQSNLLKKWVKR